MDLSALMSNGKALLKALNFINFYWKLSNFNKTENTKYNKFLKKKKQLKNSKKIA